MCSKKCLLCINCSYVKEDIKKSPKKKEQIITREAKKIKQKKIRCSKELTFLERVQFNLKEEVYA